MHLHESNGPEQGNEGVGIRFDRRTAILGAGCLTVGAILPTSAHSAGRTRRSDCPPAPTLGGQSPIDLRRDDITLVRRLPTIDFGYPQRIDVRLLNTGSPGEFATVRADVPPGAAHITLSGLRWDLQQFHWHTPSEHEIEGRDTPLEAHFVHGRGNGAILVIAVFMEEGRTNRALEPIFQQLPDEPDETRRVSGVRLRDLIPEEPESFRFFGSLTTPPFTEPVRWVVLAESSSLSRRQIGAFQELFPDGNSREVQPLGGREIFSDTDEVFDEDDEDEHDEDDD